VEVVLDDEANDPRFKIFAYENDKAVSSDDFKATMEIVGGDGKRAVVSFASKENYLESESLAQAPHEFKVKLSATRGGRDYTWEFEHLEERVKLDPESGKIGVAEAGPATIVLTVELPGEVGLNDDRTAHVVPKVAGIVSECVAKLGDYVKKGDLLAVLDSRELAEARSKYLVALQREDLARYNAERAESLWKKQVSPEREYLTMRNAHEEAKIELTAAAQKLYALGLTKEEVGTLTLHGAAPLTRYEIRSPLEGVVIKKRVSPGEWVTETSDILVVADLSSLWVHALAPVKDLEDLRVGQKAVVKSAASSIEATGELSYVGPIVGEESRTAKARVVIHNPEGKWRPGMFAHVTVIKDESRVSTAILADAVHSLKGREVVFVRSGSHFEARPVVLGRRNGKHVEALQGLSAGERYAASNSYVIAAELAKGKAVCGHSH
jgi:cobalt-zinc-cadmium efflux system membrane fusion protein